MATVIDGRESGFKSNPDYKITFEPSPRRVRVQFNGETIADSTGARLLFETRHLPVYYFPRSDVRMDLLRPTEHHTFCPYKGTASYWTIRVGDKKTPCGAIPSRSTRSTGSRITSPSIGIGSTIGTR